MPSFVVRVWLPDRPGALGAVASAIGSAGGDLTGIEILETGAGRAVDELVVSLPADGRVADMVEAVAGLAGVDVEDVHPVEDGGRMDALEAAATIVDQTCADGLEQAAVEGAARHLEASWCVVIDRDEGRACATAGEPPGEAWLAAFVAGSSSSDRVASGETGPDDIAWTPLGEGRALVLGRSGRPFRARERRQLALLGRIAGSRWHALASQPA